MFRGTRVRAVRFATVGALAALALTGCSGAAHAENAAPAAAASAAKPAVRGVLPASGSLRGGTTVTVRGTGLAGTTAVEVAGTRATLVSASASKVVLRTPAAVDYEPGAAPVVLRHGSATLATSSWRYAAVDGVDRQLHYLLTYWKDYNPAYPRLGDTDCVDFMSQSLLARGWKQQGAWSHASPVERSGKAWISSTAFRDFMGAHPELGTALTDAQRSKVKLGDVVQFDWDRSGDRDHTGVVTRIVHRADGGISIYFAGHTKDSDYRSVDTAITKDHPGGVAYYWSIK